MKVLIVGSGGREHALTWALSKSSKVSEIIVAPGNGGIESFKASIPIRTVGISAEDIEGLVEFGVKEGVEFVVVGPEVPLSNGIVDRFASNDIKSFGPSACASRLESSKAFCKDFMIKHDIPTGRYTVVNTLNEALECIRTVDYPVVIKASGLAAGKGVIIPESLDEAENAVRLIMEERRFGPAGDQVVIEERLEGTEVSLMAFSDGLNISIMPCVQDHKRLLGGDRGPNTGGMGAYAPSMSLTDQQLSFIETRILKAAVDGIRKDGWDVYTGVLYAGLMITEDGPKVLEFNCRFGDPETQALMPLLETDLLDILIACSTVSLDKIPIKWRDGYALTVVMVSEGYPEQSITGREITGIDKCDNYNTHIFHAGTRYQGNHLVTSGGRVLSVTKYAPTLSMARQEAYRNIIQIDFEGMDYRLDIGDKS